MKYCLIIPVVFLKDYVLNVSIENVTWKSFLEARIAQTIKYTIVI